MPLIYWKKEQGTKALLREAKNIITSKRFFKTKSSKKTSKNFLQSIKYKKPKFISNILKIDEIFEEDVSLRKFMQFGAHDVLSLNHFPKISIVIITYNQVEALKRNLASIQTKSTYKNFEILIITNNHDENSEMRKFLKNVPYSVHVYENEYSFGGMNNFGATKAEGDFLLFLNDDVEVESPNWLEALLTLAEDESTGIVGPKLLSPNGKLQDCGGIVWKNGNACNYGRNYDSDDPNCNFIRDVDYISGSCLLVRKELFEKVGGFDKRFHPAYCEDTDLCFSIRKLVIFH